MNAEKMILGLLQTLYPGGPAGWRSSWSIVTRGTKGHRTETKGGGNTRQSYNPRSIIGGRPGRAIVRPVKLSLEGYIGQYMIKRKRTSEAQK